MSEIGQLIHQIAVEALAEPLEAAGFKRSGRTWRRRKGDAVQVITVQGSRANAGADGRFLLNAGVYFPALADRLGLFPLTDLPSEADCHLRTRPMPPGRRWWKVRLAGLAQPDPEAGRLLGALLAWLDRRADQRADQTNARAARALRQALERYAFPWLGRTGTLAGARDELAKRGQLWWAAAASLELDDHAAAKRLYARAVASAAPARAEELRRWGRANRLE
jgi:hypothetical protein